MRRSGLGRRLGKAWVTDWLRDVWSLVEGLWWSGDACCGRDETFTWWFWKKTFKLALGIMTNLLLILSSSRTMTQSTPVRRCRSGSRMVVWRCFHGQHNPQNPLEHLWDHLKRRLGEHEKAPGGILELWERVEEEWNKIDTAVCQNLIESMPRRIELIYGCITEYF